jgi:MYXO-CTERM domain-containing protein
MVRTMAARVCFVAPLLALLLVSRNLFASGGACPSGVPVTGDSCYFIAANGSDTNDGLSEKTAWLHAPGMPSCTANCNLLQEAGVGGASMGGTGLIFRGGDTWHEGNSSASPYTGGTFDIYDWFSYAYNHPFTACKYEASQSGCLYVGVDKSWYSGTSWSRPILDGDNPVTGLTLEFAPSCPYIVPNPGPSGTGGAFGHNVIVAMASFTILDNLELTGLCADDATPNGDIYIAGGSAGNNYPAEHFIQNVYMHGWSATSNAGGGATHPLTILTGGEGSGSIYDHIVVDGSDSNPEVAAWGTFPDFEHMKYSLVRYAGQGVGSSCHDVHDNVLEHMYNTLYDGHTNLFECNSGDNLGGVPNVFYNNIFRHNDPSLGNAVGWWIPRSSGTTPTVYVFNNMIYDAYGAGIGEAWNVSCGSGGTECPGPFPPIYYFNNTSVDTSAFPCYMSTYPNESSTAYVYNNQLIDTRWDGSGQVTCNGGPGSTSNVSMRDTNATAQGYATGVSGTAGNGNNCANDTTAPCGPTSGSNSTVGAGMNLQSYCTALASYSSEQAISVDAANACRYATTDGCAYDASSHTVNCPAQAPSARPTNGAWDVGAYQCILSADGGCAIESPPLADGGAGDVGGGSGNDGGVADGGVVGIDGGQIVAGDAGAGAGGTGKSGGCGCRTVRRGDRAGALWALGLAGLVAARRRRRHAGAH